MLFYQYIGILKKTMNVCSMDALGQHESARWILEDRKFRYSTFQPDIKNKTVADAERDERLYPLHKQCINMYKVPLRKRYFYKQKLPKMQW